MVFVVSVDAQAKGRTIRHLVICRYNLKKPRFDILDRNRCIVSSYHQAEFEDLCRRIADNSEAKFKHCFLKQWSDTRKGFWYVCRDLVLMTGFRNPAPGTRGHERAFQKHWLRKSDYSVDGLKKFIWMLVCQCDQELIERIYGDDAYRTNPTWMTFARKLLMVATKLRTPAFALAPREADEKACDALRTINDPQLDFPRFLPFALMSELNSMRLHQITAWQKSGERLVKLSHPTPTDILHSFGHLVAQLDATLAATY